MAEWDAVREAVDVEGCNVNIQDEETGLSIVHWAAHQGNEEILRWLVERGAFLRLKDGRGQPALAGAKGPVEDLLLAEAYSPLERVVYRRRTLSVERLEVELGSMEAAALDEPLWDEGGASLAVVLAERHGTDGFDALPLLKWLAARGANLEAVDEEANSLLHMVDWSFGAAVALPLINWALSEAHVQHKDQRNNDGDTPALLCAYASPSGEEALHCLEVFEAAGANLALGNARGINVAMMLARHHGDGPWLAWCQEKAGVEPGALCARGRTLADYLSRYGTEESEEETEKS